MTLSSLRQEAIASSTQSDVDAPAGGRMHAVHYGIVALLILSMLIFMIRLWSVFSVGSLFTTTGIEEAPIYSVWKVAHRLPLYESPLEGYFGLGLYNWLFYKLYGSLMGLLGVDGAQLILAGRLLTVCFAMAGCAGFRQILGRITPNLAPGWAWLLSLLVWADSGEAGWWQVSVRPDFAALAAATWALWFVIKGMERCKASDLFVASCLFYTAWSFKQTTVLLFAASILTLLVARRTVAGIAALVLPFSALVAATFRMGGHNYFLNTIFAPSINAFVPHEGLPEIARACVASPFLWSGGMAGAVLMIRRAMKLKEEQDSPISLLLLMSYVVCAAGDCVGICRAGSARNTLFEFFLVSSLLTCLVVASTLQTNAGWFLRPTTEKIVLIAAALNVAILSARLIGAPGLGRMTLASGEQFAARQELAITLHELPTPIYIREGILSLPWHANGDRYPAVMDDSLFYHAAVRHGVLKEYPIEQLIGAHHFRTLLVGSGDPALGWAEQAGCALNETEAFAEWSLREVDCPADANNGLMRR